jgi:hypothetical protein
MEANFKKLLPFKSDRDLQHFLDNNSKMSQDELMAVITELQGRGRVFTETELASLTASHEALPQQEEIAAPTTAPAPWKGFNSWKENVVTDAAAPELFSQQVIMVFSVVFSVLFGSILLAVNIAKAGIKRGVIEVIAFGLGFTCAQIMIVSLVPKISTGLSIGFGFAGAMILNNYFWNKFIGKGVKYRTRSFIVPLIIALAMCAIFLFSLFSGMPPQK